jgi:hypothetical protein
MGMAKEHKNAAPEKASATAKAALRPTMYCTPQALQEARPTGTHYAALRPLSEGPDLDSLLGPSWAEWQAVC